LLSCLSGAASGLGKASSLPISILSSSLALVHYMYMYSTKAMNRVTVPVKSQLEAVVLRKKYLRMYIKAFQPSLKVAVLLSSLQIFFYLFAGCAGEGISRDKHCFDCGSSSVDLLCYVQRSWYCKMYTLCTTLSFERLITTFLQSSLVFTYVLGSAQVLYHLMKTVLFSPLDFAKHSKNYVKSSILESKKKTSITSADQLLSETIQLGGVLGSSTFKLFSWQAAGVGIQTNAVAGMGPSNPAFSDALRKLRPHCWQEVITAQHDIAEKLLCATDSSPLGPPELPFLAGLNDSGYNRQRVIAWGHCLALQDLANLSKNSKDRRRGIFDVSKGGKFVEIVVSSSAIIDATTLQLQLVIAHAVEDVLHLTMEGHAKIAGIQNDAQRRAAMAERNMGPVAHQWCGNVPYAALEIVRDGQKKLDEEWWWKTVYIRKGLLSLVGSRLFCIRRICMHPLPLAISQMTANAVDGVSVLLIKGAAEDVSSLQTHHVIAAVVCSLLGLISALHEFGDVIRRSRLGPMNGFGGVGQGVPAIRQGVYLGHDLQNLLGKANECLDNLLKTYNDVIKTYTFPSAYIAELELRLGRLAP